ncbi:tRNA-modifying protein YgfZ [Vibrio maerlii]|uniref:tRNA-modifying protein YgfZ n=1 Tax=Vibrio maerlii TaxID=2231648 RepID=UPI000E3D85E9|nr:tRNA-modifying protein YgfZ [Vibrio maerlii]
MDWQNTFNSTAHAGQESLPALMLTHLASWGAITLVGDDKKSYLHGQVTCNVVSLGQNEATLGAHCDAKGKVWSIFRLFHHAEGYALFQPLSAIDTALTELKKYAVFSKVNIELSQDIAFGILGHEAEAWINQHFAGEGSVRHNDLGSAVELEAQRWLLLVKADKVDELLVSLDGAVRVKESIWQRFDIEAALPAITTENQAEQIPQAFNLQALDAISFNKGCYTGQETVARAKYRGMNKRATYRIRSCAGIETQAEAATFDLERSVGENWRNVGSLMNHFQFDDGTVIGLIVLPNNLDADTQFRTAGDSEQLWTIEALPYSLEEE